MILYILLFLIILVIIIWGGVTQWRFIKGKDKEGYDKNFCISSVTGDKFQIPANIDKKWLKDFQDRLQGWEPKTNKLLNKLVLKCDNDTNIIDAGAHVGDTLLVMAKTLQKNRKKSKIKLHGIDPNKSKLEFIKKIANTNNINNIKTIYGGLSDKSNKGKLIKHGHAGMWKIEESNDSTVPLFSIDSLNLGKISLIHLDVEGYEYKALLGAKNTILRDKPYLIIEILHGDFKEKIIPYLKSLNYEIDWEGENNVFFKSIE
jgi:FkbM family methyltransferase